MDDTLEVGMDLYQSFIFAVWNSLLGFDYAGSEVDLFGKVVPFRWPGVFWSTSSYAIRFFFCDS